MADETQPVPQDEAERLALRLLALGSVQRLRIIAELHAGEHHVSELARRVGMSRALLYMHLSKLEEAGYVSGRLELGDAGKAVKIYSIASFSLTIDPKTIAKAVAADHDSKE